MIVEKAPRDLTGEVGREEDADGDMRGSAKFSTVTCVEPWTGMYCGPSIKTGTSTSMMLSERR
jgi:hypothetical protein